MELYVTRPLEESKKKIPPSTKLGNVFQLPFLPLSEHGGLVPDREREDQTEVPARREREKKEGRWLEMDEWKGLGGVVGRQMLKA